MSKNKENEAEDRVLDFINKNNRPYSATDVSNHLQKEYGKTAIIRALDSLAAKKLIIEKAYGKQKVYMPDQEQFPVVQETELKTFDSQISELMDKVKDAKNEIILLEGQLKAYEVTLTIEEAKKKYEELEHDKIELQDDLDRINSNDAQITEEEKEKTLKDNQFFTKEFKSRKRMVNEILDTILENYPKNKKQLLEEIGIDEEPNPL